MIKRTISNIVKLRLFILLVILFTSCAQNQTSIVFIKNFINESEFGKLTANGIVITQEGEKIQLACIAMKSLKETLEPELINAINGIIVKESSRISIIKCKNNHGIISYKQRVSYSDRYGLGMLRYLWEPVFTRGTINELIIAMGAGHYSDSNCCDPSYINKLLTLQEEYDYALWTKYGKYQLVSSITDSRPIYRSWKKTLGYMPRSNLADNRKRKTNLEEGEKKIFRLKQRLDNSTDSTQILNNAYFDNNRILRRYVVGQFRNVHTLIPNTITTINKACNDEDKTVRETAEYILRKHGLSCTSQKVYPGGN